jgi:hypothetical protein
VRAGICIWTPALLISPARTADLAAVVVPGHLSRRRVVVADLEARNARLDDHAVDPLVRPVGDVVAVPAVSLGPPRAPVRDLRAVECLPGSEHQREDGGLPLAAPHDGYGANHVAVVEDGAVEAEGDDVRQSEDLLPLLVYEPANVGFDLRVVDRSRRYGATGALRISLPYPEMGKKPDDDRNDHPSNGSAVRLIQWMH